MGDGSERHKHRERNLAAYATHRKSRSVAPISSLASRIATIAHHKCTFYIRDGALIVRDARGYRVGQTRREFLKSTTQAAAVAGLAANLPASLLQGDAL